MKHRLFCLYIIFFCSCKGDDVFEDIVPNTSRVIAEFTDARTGTIVTHNAVTGHVEINVTELRIDPRSVLNGQAKVKVIVNPIVVTEYNTANGTGYLPIPAAAFTLAPNEYQFNKSQRKTMVRAAMNPSVLLNGEYAIGLSIAEVRGGEIGVAGKNVIVFLSIKNRYDGIYSLKGYSEIPGTSYNGHFNLPCSQQLELRTGSVNSVIILPTQPVADGNSFTYISNLLPEISFDAATNKVAAVSTIAGGIDLIFPFDAGYDSRYDPATKTIYVKYGIALLSSGRFIIDTLNYCGPR